MAGITIDGVNFRGWMVADGNYKAVEIGTTRTGATLYRMRMLEEGWQELPCRAGQYYIGLSIVEAFNTDGRFFGVPMEWDPDAPHIERLYVKLPDGIDVKAFYGVVRQWVNNANRRGVCASSQDRESITEFVGQLKASCHSEEDLEAWLAMEAMQ